MKLKFIILIIVALFLGISAGCILLNLTVYTTQPFDRGTLISHTNQTDDTNSKVDFLTTESIITATPIHSGDLMVMLSNPVNLSHPAFAGVEDQEIMVPIFVYLIHHETYGYFMVDSGCTDSYASTPYGPMKGLLVPSAMPETKLEADQSVESQLSAFLQEIKAVFFTHLHFDHTSGVPALTDKMLFFAGKGEQSTNIKWLLEANHFEKTDVVYLFDFDGDDVQDLPVGKAIDVFGDQSFWAISTPGHSKGHVSYLVNTPDHPVFIAGDAIITNQCFALGVSSGTSSADIQTDQKTVERIKTFIDDYPEIKVWAGHDYPTQLYDDETSINAN